MSLSEEEKNNQKNKFDLLKERQIKGQLTSPEASLLTFYETINSKLKEAVIGILLNKEILVSVFLYTRSLNKGTSLNFLLEVGEDPKIKNNGTFEAEDEFKNYGDNLKECSGFLTYQEDSDTLKSKVVAYEKPLEFLHNKCKLVGRQGVAFVLNEQSPNKKEFEEKKRAILDFLMKADLLSSFVPPTMTANQTELDRVIGIFEELLLYGTWGINGQLFFREKLEFFMSRGLPIIFILAAFTFKSPNNLKVTGHLPDKAEELALEKLADFCIKVGKVYSPGAKIVIHSDSQVADILLDSQDRYKAAEYLKCLREMAEKNGYDEHISFQGLNKYFETDEHSLPDMNKVFELCGHNQTSIKTKYETEKSKDQIGIFILKDIKFRNPSIDKNRSHIVSLAQFEIHLAPKAVELYFMYKYADRFVRTNLMPLALKIQVHKDENTGPGFSVRLVEGRDAQGKPMSMTPWHSVAVEYENGKYCLMQKKNDFEAKYEPVYQGSETPYYYRKKAHSKDTKLPVSQVQDTIR